MSCSAGARRLARRDVRSGYFSVDSRSISAPTAFAAAPTARSRRNLPSRSGRRRVSCSRTAITAIASSSARTRGSRATCSRPRSSRASPRSEWMSAHRPTTDARRRVDHAFDARRCRRGDLRIAQSVRGQRHQGVRARRLQAVGRVSRPRSKTDGRRPQRPTSTNRRPSAVPNGSRTRAAATSFTASARSRERALDGLRIVLDCAHGAAYRVAPAVLWELGAEVIKIGVDPDGFNINRECGSTARRAPNKVREVRADIGIALDGDADRCCRRRTRPRRRWRPDHGGDRAQLKAEAGSPSRRGRDRDVEPRSRALSRNVGLKLARTAVGDRYVVEHMREHGYNVGGEQSGHMIRRLRHHRRRPGRGAARAGGGEEAGRAGDQRLSPLRGVAADPAERPLHAGASRWRTQRSRSPSRAPSRSPTATAAW